MRVALYGATGNAGSRILKELLGGGHQVTAIVRDPVKILDPASGVIVRRDDLSDPRSLSVGY